MSLTFAYLNHRVNTTNYGDYKDVYYVLNMIEDYYHYGYITRDEYEHLYDLVYFYQLEDEYMDDELNSNIGIIEDTSYIEPIPFNPECEETIPF